MAHRGQNRLPAMVQVWENGRWIAADAGIGVSPAPTLLYLNSSTGNDANAGTIGAPLATLGEALRRVGRVVRSTCEIRITGGGPYNGDVLGVSREYGANFLDIIADVSTEILVASGTVTSSTYQEITDSAQTWTIDELAGLTLRVLTGAQAQEERKIVANTSAAATLVDGFSSNLAPGDTFEIVRPGVIFTFSPFSVIYGDPRGYLSLQNVELQWTDALYFFGSTYLVGVTAQTGATVGDVYILGQEGGPYCDFYNGFGWRQVGASPVGTIYVTGSSGDLTLCGHLGYVILNNSGGIGHTGGVAILGRAALDATSCDLIIGAIGFNATRIEVFYDNVAGAVTNGPFWMLGGRGEVTGVMNVGGTGGLAGRIALRDQAFLELTAAVSAGYVDLAIGSRIRIASGNDGGFSSIFVDSVNTLTANPAVTFATSGEVYIGDQDSVAVRD